MSSNKATILKAVGSSNEAGATKLIADIDMGLGESHFTSKIMFLLGRRFQEGSDTLPVRAGRPLSCPPP